MASINIRDLEYVVALEAERSFSRAAERCGVAQPTLSAQVRKLEETLGGELFERDGRDLRLTPLGVDVVEHARSALQSVRAIEDAAAGADPFAGPLRVGIIPTLGPYVLPSTLPLAARALPRARLVVVEDLTERLIARLLAGTLDAAIVATAHPSAKLSETMLFDEPFWLALPPGHPLAALDRVPVERITASSLILLTEGHCLADQAFSLCSKSAHSVSDLRGTSLETVLNLVEAGLGITVVPELARVQAARRFPDLEFRPLDGAGAQRQVRMLYRPFSPRREALAELAAITAKASSVPLPPGRRPR